MLVLLRDGPKKGDVYEVPEQKEGVFSVILTENHYYAFAEYMLIPANSINGERMAIFIRAIKR